MASTKAIACGSSRDRDSSAQAGTTGVDGFRHGISLVALGVSEKGGLEGRHSIFDFFGHGGRMLGSVARRFGQAAHDDGFQACWDGSLRRDP